MYSGQSQIFSGHTVRNTLSSTRGLFVSHATTIALVSASNDRKVCEEGCLSVPGFYENVERPDRVCVRARDEHGREFTIDAEGLLAVCIQHEMDHLKGRVFVQYLSRLKQYRIRAKLLKQDREAA